MAALHGTDNTDGTPWAWVNQTSSLDGSVVCSSAGLGGCPSYSTIATQHATPSTGTRRAMPSAASALVVPPITSTQRLSWASSIFYFGMLAGVMPLTYAFQRFHLSRVIGAAVVIWGLCCMSTALVTDHRGLYVQRFFLGALESGVSPGWMLVVGG